MKIDRHYVVAVPVERDEGYVMELDELVRAEIAKALESR